MRALCWFRADLRVADNPALHQACELATDGVIGVFVVSAVQWRQHDLADARVDLCLRTLATLGDSLAARNIALRIVHAPRFDDVPGVLLGLARELACDALFLNREYEVHELRRDAAVERVFRDADIPVHACHDQTVVEPGQLQTRAGGDYTVYTPFRRAWLRHVADTGLPAPLPAPARRQAMVSAPDPVPDSVDGFLRTPLLHSRWPAGEGEAMRRLQEFLDHRVGRYAGDRDLPALEGTGTLSPYLASGTISALTCLCAAVRRNDGRLESGGRPGLDSWIQQLIWREFYRNVMFCFPRVSMGRPFRLDTEGIPWRQDNEGFGRWSEGRTGVPIVDAGMRQLRATGWMHNRLRMVTAMFLSKDLMIDWRWGERWFMRHLVDGDLANNNGGWQWAASTGTDAVPYFRIFNPYRQGRRFDRDGDYVRRWVPELASLAASALHDPATLARLRDTGLDYPPPLIDHGDARRRALALFHDHAGGR